MNLTFDQTDNDSNQCDVSDKYIFNKYNESNGTNDTNEKKNDKEVKNEQHYNSYVEKSEYVHSENEPSYNQHSDTEISEKYQSNKENLNNEYSVNEEHSDNEELSENEYSNNVKNSKNEQIKNELSDNKHSDNEFSDNKHSDNENSDNQQSESNDDDSDSEKEQTIDELSINENTNNDKTLEVYDFDKYIDCLINRNVDESLGESLYWILPYPDDVVDDFLDEILGIKKEPKIVPINHILEDFSSDCIFFNTSLSSTKIGFSESKSSDFFEYMGSLNQCSDKTEIKKDIKELKPEIKDIKELKPEIKDTDYYIKDIIRETIRDTFEDMDHTFKVIIKETIRDTFENMKNMNPSLVTCQSTNAVLVQNQNVKSTVNQGLKSIVNQGLKSTVNQGLKSIVNQNIIPGIKPGMKSGVKQIVNPNPGLKSEVLPKPYVNQVQIPNTLQRINPQVFKHGINQDCIEKMKEKEEDENKESENSVIVDITNEKVPVNKVDGISSENGEQDLLKMDLTNQIIVLVDFENVANDQITKLNNSIKYIMKKNKDIIIKMLTFAGFCNTRSKFANIVVRSNRLDAVDHYISYYVGLLEMKINPPSRIHIISKDHFAACLQDFCKNVVHNPYESDFTKMFIK